jgi:thiamine biosynthesis lipoprotein
MMNRRRAITILAGGAILPATGGFASPGVRGWRGIALGADARIVLDHPDAARLIDLAVGEIRRLEGVFSLYRADSQVSRLNRDGVLDNPAFEMVELLSVCSGLHARTGGVFDPTVQRLWSVYAAAFSAGAAPREDEIAGALEVTGWEHVRVSAGRVGFERAGMALTLNGIAQGYIADRVVAVLRGAGVENVLVNAGEIAAVGHAPDGNDWQVRPGSADAAPVGLSNMAIATSAPLGTTFDSGDRVGHILDPRTGKPGGIWPRVSVISPSAALSDGLSTAFCLMTRQEIDAVNGGERVLFG